jgi:hypothetical protein
LFWEATEIAGDFGGGDGVVERFAHLDENVVKIFGEFGLGPIELPIRG